MTKLKDNDGHVVVAHVPATGKWATESEGVAAPMRRFASEEVTVVIAKAEALAEMLPGLIRMANMVGGGPSHYARRDSLPDSLGEAVSMLREFRGGISDSEAASRERHLREIAEQSKGVGIAIGIAQEKQRVKEARRGRK